MHDNQTDKWHRPNPALLAQDTAADGGLVEIPCGWCEEPYRPERPWGQFCSGRCRVAAFRAREKA